MGPIFLERCKAFSSRSEAAVPYTLALNFRETMGYFTFHPILYMDSFLSQEF